MNSESSTQMAKTLIEKFFKLEPEKSNDRSKSLILEVNGLIQNNGEAEALGRLATLVALGCDQKNNPPSKFQGFVISQELMDISDRIRHEMRMGNSVGRDVYSRLMGNPSYNYVLAMN